MDLWSYLSDKFLQHDDRPSINNPDGDYITYRELLTKICTIKKSLADNIESGSRIGIINKYSYNDAIGILSTLSLGSIVIPISLKYGISNCCQIIKKAEPQIIFTDMELPGPIAELLKKDDVKIINLVKMEQVMASEKEICSCRNRNNTIANNIAMIMFTSGTTGVPKGAVLSHSNILSNLSDIDLYFKLTSKDHILIARPLYHVAVMTGEFLYGLMCGCKITFYSEAFFPKILLSKMEEIKCTTMCGTPTLFYHMSISKKKDKQLSYLKKIVVSGECLSPKVANALIESFPDIDFFNVYGLTEASPRVSYLKPEYFASKIGSVGKPLQSVTVKIVDDNHNELPEGEIGELIVKGPNVMRGYWQDSRLTHKKIKNGWLYTGDLAYFKGGGYLYIVGRKDNMIIRAGLNIYPQEIENILLKDEEIKEVIVWGENDNRYGQRLCMAVVNKKDRTKFKEYVMSVCRKRLQPYQRPDELYIVDSLPRNASGKLLRKRTSFL